MQLEACPALQQQSDNVEEEDLGAGEAAGGPLAIAVVATPRLPSW